MEVKYGGNRSFVQLITLVKTALKDKQDALTYDQAPTAGSTNAVTSGAVYQAISDAVGDIDAILAEIVGGG